MGKSYGEIFHEMATMPNVQWPEVWQAILETLYMTIVSTLFAFVLGLILGVLLFLSAKSNSLAAKIFYTIVSFIVNLFRAIPFIILILLLIPFTSILLGTISGPLVHYQHLLLVQHHSTLDWSRLLLKKLIKVL